VWLETVFENREKKGRGKATQFFQQKKDFRFIILVLQLLLLRLFCKGNIWVTQTLELFLRTRFALHPLFHFTGIPIHLFFPPFIFECMFGTLCFGFPDRMIVIALDETTFC